MITKIIIIFAYIGVMALNGIVAGKKAKNADSFYTGGRSIGAFASACAYFTTFFSAVMFTITGSSGYAFGISAAWVGIMNAIISGWLAWKLLAPRTKRLAEETGAFTLPQMIEKKSGSSFMRFFLAGIILIFLIPYTASVYQGISYIFRIIFDVPFTYCIIGLALVTAFYTTIGGNSAVVSNAVIQGVLIFVCVVVYYFAFFKSDYISGISTGLNTLAALEGGDMLTSVFGGKNFFSVFSVVIMTSVGGCATPQLISKFVSVKENEIKKTGVITTVSCLIIAGGMYFVGSFSQIFFQKGYLPPADSLDKVTGSIMYLITNDIFFTLIFVMLLASSMSTLAAIVLTAASTLTEDLLPLAFRTIDKNNTMLPRIFCAIFIAISALLSIVPNSVVSLMSISWGMIACVCIGPYWYCLFSDSVSKTVCIITSVFGFCAMSVGVLVLGLPKAAQAACIGILLTIVFFFITVLLSKSIRGSKEKYRLD